MHSLTPLPPSLQAHGIQALQQVCYYDVTLQKKWREKKTTLKSLQTSLHTHTH